MDLPLGNTLNESILGPINTDVVTPTSKIFPASNSTASYIAHNENK